MDTHLCPELQFAQLKGPNIKDKVERASLGAVHLVCHAVLG